MHTITKKNVMAMFARMRAEAGITMESAAKLWLRRWEDTNPRHVQRFNEVIRSLRRRGWIANIEEDGNKPFRFIPTDRGIAWNRGERLRPA